MRDILTLSLPLALIGLIAPALARANDCDAPLAAWLKLNDTPYHMRMTETGGTDDESGQPTAMEVIVTTDKMFVNVGGQWHSGPKDADDADEIRDTIKSGGMICKYLRDEAIGGVAAAAYHVDDKSDPDEPKAETVWIGKDAGQLLKMDLDTDASSSVGKSQATMSFDYQDVAAPAGAD